ncbi:thiamine diphosphokinase [Clostridium sp.]|uniref:thiamine diphosphokinase n=1 Tax=Clostridium sp. TaxID=1506 RepID=UPI003F2A4850
MNALIISGGKEPSEELLKSLLDKVDIIIGADRGCETLYKYKIQPHYILGDFDSASKETISKIESLGVNKIKFKAEKDFTDTESAFNLALEKGATKIFMLGVTGTRYDHALGNIGLLKKALKLGIDCEILDDNNRIYMIDKNITLKGNKGDIVSFQAYSEVVKGLSIIGAKYELENYDLHIGDSLTISNEFNLNNINISFDYGILMVLHTKD